MSRYVVRTVGPAGRERYLWRGREVDGAENATHYPHPSAAIRAMESHRNRHRGELFHSGVLDTRDPERGEIA